MLRSAIACFTALVRTKSRLGCQARRRLHGLLLGMILAIAASFPAPSATAFELIEVGADAERIDLATETIDRYSARGDRLQVETAPGADGLVSRMEVKAATPGTDPNWTVFALKNPTDRVVERWLVAERYTIIGSGLVWPDLDSVRLAAVTPSVGFVPKRIPSDRVDIFGLSIAPGATVTFVTELASDRYPKLQIWDPLIYEKRLREQALFNGIMLGITGVIAVFLTAIFAANHKMIFPAAALVAWSVLCYLAVDLGFWNRIFQLPSSETALYRAACEAAIIASLVVFLYTFLRLWLWHSWLRLLLMIWMLAQAALVVGAVIDPPLAATFARASFSVFAGLGTMILLYQSARGQDRALSLVPAWLLLLVWIFAAGVAATGRLNGELVAPGLVSGLVLILVLLSFTVTQYAFRGLDPVYGGPQNDLQLRAVAIEAAGAAVFEWNSRRDEVTTSALVEQTLGLLPGELSCRTEDWQKHLHPADRDRFRQVLTSIQEKNGGSLNLDLRMRRTDSSYRWFELRAEAMPQPDQRTLRCVGLLRDVTGAKRAQEWLVQDAVRDNLTGLPNRALLLDRLNIVVERARLQQGPRPTVLLVDIDRFKSVNATFGLIVGDSMLLTVARRLIRHLQPHDTLARLGGDRFALMIASEHNPRDIAMLAERVRRALRSPMKISGKEIVLTGSIGIAVCDGSQKSGTELIGEAEAAVFRAKRAGTDRIEIFKPSMRGEQGERAASDGDVMRAVERKHYKLLYRPVLRLSNDELAGFELELQWTHPRLGVFGTAEFMRAAGEAGVVAALGSQLIERAASDASRWQRQLPRPDDPLFVSVDVPGSQLARPEFLQEMRHLFGRESVPRGCLKLNVAEAVVMENPEQTGEVLETLRQSGAGIVLDDFAAGFSSMQHLTRFAFDAVKIDRVLVHEAGHDDASAALARSIVALMHELQKSVVAEGIDTPEDAGFLRSIGCDFGSGVLYGDAMTDREVAEVLDEMRRSERRSERGGVMDMLRSLAGRRPVSEPKAADSGESRARPVPAGQTSGSPNGQARRQRPGADAAGAAKKGAGVPRRKAPFVPGAETLDPAEPAMGHPQPAPPRRPRRPAPHPEMLAPEPEEGFAPAPVDHWPEHAPAAEAGLTPHDDGEPRAFARATPSDDPEPLPPADFEPPGERAYEPEPVYQATEGRWPEQEIQPLPLQQEQVLPLEPEARAGDDMMEPEDAGAFAPEREPAIERQPGLASFSRLAEAAGAPELVFDDAGEDVAIENGLDPDAQPDPGSQADVAAGPPPMIERGRRRRS